MPTTGRTVTAANTDRGMCEGGDHGAQLSPRDDSHATVFSGGHNGGLVGVGMAEHVLDIIRPRASEPVPGMVASPRTGPWPDSETTS